MPDNIYIGNFGRGLTNAKEAFAIDNDAFPTMWNFYSWRGRAKRKRGTGFLGILQIQVQMVAANPTAWQFGPLTLVAGEGNLLTFLGLSNGPTIVPGSITLVVGANTYTEPTIPNGTLIGSPAGSGKINYATGAITISGGGGSIVTGFFSYYPELPVMGLEDFTAYPSGASNPLLLAFDTEKAYQINQTISPPEFYNVSYYKATSNPVTWSGFDYQLFWTTNYSGAFWATNNKPGLHFVNGTYISGSGTSNITFNFKSGGLNFTTLVDGDVLWFNEWKSAGVTINGITGIVTDNTGAALGNYVVTFTGNQTVSGTGIAQLLTNSISGQDGIKWYDGDQTNHTGLPTNSITGWVNFSPPLTLSTVSIANFTPGTYYLVGALMITEYKDRLLFIGPYIQTTSGLGPFQLIDTVLWSWNGTPFYTTSTTSSGASQSGTASLVPANYTADEKAYIVDQTGLGGYKAAGLDLQILTMGFNQDALIMGLGGDGRKVRFVYSGNDLDPFYFFNVNIEFPSFSTFATTTMDRGIIDVGSYGIALTDQQSTQRLDSEIPNNVFQISFLNQGAQRVNGTRDYINEWIYISYPFNDSSWKFPTQTFFYNYRDATWAVFYENFTAHGYFRAQSTYTWATVPFATWSVWNEPWNTGANSPLVTQVVAGNPQGIVLIKNIGTGEAPSLMINAISNASGLTQITSYNHCVEGPNGVYVNTADYLYIQGALGINSATITGITLGNPTVITAINTFTVGQNVTFTGVGGTTQLNGNTYTVSETNGVTFTINIDSTSFGTWTSGGIATVQFNNTVVKVLYVIDANNFVVDLPYPTGSAYIGLGMCRRLSQPLLQTKQFNPYWEQGRQVRLGVQQYLLDRTNNAQITLGIYLSQDPNDQWNSIQSNPSPNGLIYSQTLFTCPENREVSSFNANLQQPIADYSSQIWHRMNTSMIGDTFQIGFTLNDAQMRSYNFSQAEITLHGMQFTVHTGPLLS